MKLGDLRKLPYKNESFDYAVSFASLHHLKKPENGVKELSRILKPKGYAYITSWNKLQPKFLLKRKETYIKWGKEERYYHFISFIQMRRMLKQYGFEILKSKLFGKNIEFLVQKI